MKLPFLIPIFCYLFFTPGCTQNMWLPSTEKNMDKTCADTIMAYKQVIIPGVQQTDLEGNPVNKKITNYHIYVLSNSTDLKIDSLKTGNRIITTPETIIVSTTPVYWDTADERLILVAKTTCVVYKIQFDYNGIEQPGEENDITLYYSQNGSRKEIITKEVKTLPQMITQ